MRLTVWRPWGLAVLSGLLQVLPFPIAGPVPLWRTAICWVALVPLLLALVERPAGEGRVRLGRCVLLGYACGVTWYLGNCYWIYQTMYLYGGLPKPVALAILLLFALYLGLYHALFAGLVGMVRRSGLGCTGALLLAPFLWVTVELARARVTGFPWDLLGYTQIDNLLLSRLAPVTGVLGMSFVIAAVNSLWLVRIRVRERRHTRVALTAAGVVLVLGYVLAVRRAQFPVASQTTASATLVQENLSVGVMAAGQAEETQEQMLAEFSDLSVHPGARLYAGIPEAAGTPAIAMQRQHLAGPVRAGLIVWPEAPSHFFSNDARFREQMNGLAKSSGAVLVIGSIGVVPRSGIGAGERPYFEYDSASYFTPDGSTEARYDKVHLVPWGEYIPFREVFSFARKLTAGAGDMDPGADRGVFRHEGHTYGTFVCYESIFGDEVRQFVAKGADVLVNISDDGWYGDTGAPWQHLNMVRMRALENHRWILRSTNTGVTSSINPYGRVMLAAPRHVRTSLHAPFGYRNDLTFYTRHGDWFGWLCVLVTAGALGWAARERSGAMGRSNAARSMQ